MASSKAQHPQRIQRTRCTSLCIAPIAIHAGSVAGMDGDGCRAARGLSDAIPIQWKVVGKEVAVCMPTRVFSPKGLFDE